MKTFVTWIRTYPVAISAVLVAGFQLGSQLGWYTLSQTDLQSITAFVALVFGYVAHQSVTPNVSLKK